MVNPNMDGDDDLVRKASRQSTILGPSGVYFDGQSARANPVVVHLDHDNITISGMGVDETWQVKDIYHIGDRFSKDQLTVGCHAEEDDDRSPRLQIDDPDLIQQIRQQGLKLRHRDNRPFKIMSVVSITLMALIAFIWYLPSIVLVGADAFSRDWEEQVALNAEPAVLRMFTDDFSKPKVCVGQAGQAAIDALVEKLDKVDQSGYKYKVSVVQSEVVNAFALPAGRIVFLSQIIEEMENQEEFSAVLAHEMAHVVERHTVKRIVRGAVISFVAAVITGDFTGSTAGAIGEGMANLHHAREQEAQADKMGLSYLKSLNYRTDGLSSFFTRMDEKHGSALQLLSTHPPSSKRAADNAGIDPGAVSALNDEEWLAIRSMCDEIKDS